MKLLCHMWLCVAAAAAAKLLQSCPTLCDPIDGSPPGSTFPGILQARTLEWVAISFSKGMKNRAILPDLRKRYDPVGKRGKPHSQNLETIFFQLWVLGMWYKMHCYLSSRKTETSLGWNHQENQGKIPQVMGCPSWDLIDCTILSFVRAWMDTLHFLKKCIFN